MSKAKVAVVGATGYGGAEILRCLLAHPHATVERAIAIDRVGESIGEVHHSLYGLTDLVVENIPVKRRSRAWTPSLHCHTRPQLRC